MEADRVTKIYAEIDKYTITLDPDPAGRGPKYLQEVISECRGYLNRTSLLLSQIHQEQHELTIMLRTAELGYEVSKNDLLVNDNRVSNLPSIDDRMASVNVILRPALDEIAAFKAQLLDLQHIEKVVKNRHQELKATMTDVRTQRSLIRDFLDTGSFYGKEDAGDKTDDSMAIDDDMDGLEDLIQKQLEEDDETEAAETTSDADDEEDLLDREIASAEGDDEEEIIEEDVSETQSVAEVEEEIVEENVEEEAPQDVVGSNGADHNESDDAEEDAEIEAFLDDEDDELSAILDSIE